MKDFADLDINMQSDYDVIKASKPQNDDDRQLQKFGKELAKRLEGGDRFILQCTNPAGAEQCVFDIKHVIMLGHHVDWFICRCDLSTRICNYLFDLE